MKKLKIIEQLIILLVVMALLPLLTAGFIVQNVNQHAVRKELEYSTSITAASVYQGIKNKIEIEQNFLGYVAKGLTHMSSMEVMQNYLIEMANLSELVSSVAIAKKTKPVEFDYSPETKQLALYAKINNDLYLREFIALKSIEKELENLAVSDKKEIYIVDKKNNLLASLNYDDKNFYNVLKKLPPTLSFGKPIKFWSVKNQPNVLIRLQEPDWKIIVSTPKSAEFLGIIKSRKKIIWTCSIAAFSILAFGLVYIFSLYTNFRQLFKAIKAISKGNYRRKIRLIENGFTPFEFVFLAEKFNTMADKIDESYKKIQKKNKKLAKMDEFKSNLIDTVSHEFRTPLTSIKGYTSRLLRNDAQIDDTIKTKSLKIIKQQSERLGRLVEDLLVVPDIESSAIRMHFEDISLKELLDIVLPSIKTDKKINLDFDEEISDIYADRDRLEQILINLLDNAVKYSADDSEITFSAQETGNAIQIKIQNPTKESIAPEKINSLFGKFVRLEADLRREARGTGLGLFIVKGLTEKMNGKIKLSSANGFEVVLTLPKAQENV